jgi:hypothetical protein
MVVGGQNVINEPLVARDGIILPPLHIKLGLMKQFLKVLNKDGSCTEYVAHKLPGLNMEKLKAGIFDGPKMRQLINDPHFTASMNEIESCVLVFIYSCCEKLSWQQEGRELHTVGREYALSFQQAWL